MIVRNWSRAESASPVEIAHPASVDAVVALVRSAADRGLRVKAIGAGHSFTSIALTDGVLVDLSGLSGVHAVEGTRVRLGAGTHLHHLPELLAPYSLALANMGDIDRQTIAGATSTGTHGTGIGFGGLATQITAVTLVTGSGDLLRISASERPELFHAARLGLGALGILVELEVECVPAFRLGAVERPGDFDEVLDDWVGLVRGADHFEAYWWPHTDWMSTKTNSRLPADATAPGKSRLSTWVDEELLGNAAGLLVAKAGHRLPGLTPRINELVGRIFANSEYTGVSHEVFTSPRRVRFKEMEYALPLEALPDAVRELRALIDRKGWRISFPVELRAAAADDNWLSTAYGRETSYVAIHRYWREDHRPYFAAAEEIFRAHDGRPHWGKMHTRTAEDLAPAYPRFGAFLAVRDQLDPERVFANAYADRVLGA